MAVRVLIFIRRYIIIILQEPKFDLFTKCPYLSGKKERLEYMFATGVTKEEFNKLLLSGWRRFGYFFFRPRCEICNECIPIRVKVNDFKLTRSFKRIINKNKFTSVVFKELKFRDEIYEIYNEHSLDRFNQQTDIEDFKKTFFQNAVCAMQSEYYVDNKLAAIGFIDLSSEAFSSVYFIYKSEYNHLSLGTFGAIKEIEHASYLNLNFYYLGYYIKENKSMSYKSKFKPFDLFDWKKNKWVSY